MTTSEDNKNVIKKFIKEYIEQGNIAVATETTDQNFLNHTAPNNFPSDISGLKKFVEIMQEGFPGYQVEIIEIIAENDSVAVNRVFHAVHSKDILGYKAKGKKITIHGLEIYHLRNGKISDYWSRNNHNIIQALGE